MAKNLGPLRRFWIEPNEIVGSAFEIKDETFHHVVVVTRLREGDEFELICGRPQAIRVRLQSVKKKTALVEVINTRSLAEQKSPKIHLCFAVPKWPVLDAVIEKCVELGVESVIPILSEFSSIRELKDYSSSRHDRLSKIVKSATVQTGRGSLLKLEEPVSFQVFIQKTNLSSSQVGLMAYEGRPAAQIRPELQRLLVSKDVQDIYILVGAEGGWSEAEVSLARARQWPVVTVGPQILRAETACLTLVSVIKYEAGLMQ